MSELQRGGATPTLEVRILRDGVVVQRELCESEAEAAAVVETWSDVEGVVCEVEDLTRDGGQVGVLDPRPWEVDADSATYEASYADEEER